MEAKYSLGKKVNCLSVVYDGSGFTNGLHWVVGVIVLVDSESEEPLYTVKCNNGLWWQRRECEIMPIDEGVYPPADLDEELVEKYEKLIKDHVQFRDFNKVRIGFIIGALERSGLPKLSIALRDHLKRLSSE